MKAHLEICDRSRIISITDVVFDLARFVLIFILCLSIRFFLRIFGRFCSRKNLNSKANKTNRPIISLDLFRMLNIP